MYQDTQVEIEFSLSEAKNYSFLPFYVTYNRNNYPEEALHKAHQVISIDYVKDIVTILYETILHS